MQVHARSCSSAPSPCMREKERVSLQVRGFALEQKGTAREKGAGARMVCMWGGGRGSN